MTRIAETEMATFEKAIRDYGRFRLRGQLPASLQKVDLEQGDYRDPWNTEYIYERIGPTKGILISAGPDRVYHTRDDLIHHIRM